MDSDLQAIVDRLNRENAQAAEQISRAQRNAFQTASELAVRMGAQDPTLRPGIRERVLSEGIVLYEAQ